MMVMMLVMLTVMNVGQMSYIHTYIYIYIRKKQKHMYIYSIYIHAIFCPPRRFAPGLAPGRQSDEFLQTAPKSRVYTQKTYRKKYTEEFLHVFTHRRFYTEMFLHGEFFTHRSFHKQ